MRGCGLSKSLSQYSNHRQATSSQNLKGLHIINNYTAYNHNIKIASIGHIKMFALPEKG
jgi:hypothetical protein